MRFHVQNKVFPWVMANILYMSSITLLSAQLNTLASGEEYTCACDVDYHCFEYVLGKLLHKYKPSLPPINCR